MKKYIVTLTEGEREELSGITSKGKHRSQKMLNALILLGCDEGEFQKERSINEEMARVLNISMKKIDRVKKRFAEKKIPASPGRAAKHDYEYRRCGVCNVFLACEPLAGKRMVTINERKTKRDWAFFWKKSLADTKARRK